MRVDSTLGPSNTASGAFSLTWMTRAKSEVKDFKGVSLMGHHHMQQSFMDFLGVIGSFITSNNISALATVVIAAFTITLWVATSRQAELTREALIANKRAFVYATNIFSAFSYDNTNKMYNWRFRPVLRNNGDTPTKNLTMFVTCEVRNSEIPIGYPFTHDSQQVAHGTIGPRFELYGGLTPPPQAAAITPQDIIDAQAERKFIYVWGWVKYYDVFPRHHSTLLDIVGGLILLVTH
jgi:hypothetical protein